MQPGETSADPLKLPENIKEKLLKLELLPCTWSSTTSPLKGKKVDLLLQQARHPVAALAAMHMLSCRMAEISVPSKSLFLDAGRVPIAGPKYSLPPIRSSSQILLATSLGNGQFTLRWLLEQEIWGAYGWDGRLLRLSFYPSTRRWQILATG